MKFTLKTNISEIIEKLKNKDTRALLAARNGMIKGMQLFSSYLIANQMTGRPGLRVQTGTLRRSWDVNDWKENSDIVVRLATDTEYAIYHEESKPNLAPKIPKRLHVIKSFNREGLKIISKETARSLFKEYAK